MLKEYYRLTKPGIIYGNDLSAVAGFLLGASLLKHFSIAKFVALLLGMSLVIGCGCVLNNVMDRGVDRKMARTSKRALVTGRIKPSSAIIFGALLGLIGFAVLAVFTNALTVVVGATGLFFYLVMYGIWKRRGPIGTVVGSVSGAMPIVGGYTAATGHLNTAALLLFLGMVVWQMPHFYAIAMFRLKDYKKAGIPVLPVVHGMRKTKIQIVLYVCAFLVIAELLTVTGYTGYVFVAVMAVVCTWWIKLALDGFQAKDDALWARKAFFGSLVVLMVYSAALSVGALLP